MGIPQLGRVAMKYNWWALQIFLTVVSACFLAFGINLLMDSYALNDPFNFIMVFFAASLMILISATLMAGFIVKMFRVFKTLKNANQLD